MSTVAVIENLIIFFSAILFGMTLRYLHDRYYDKKN